MQFHWTAGHPGLDGINLLPLLTGERAAPGRPIFMRKYDQGVSLIRCEAHKLIEIAGKPTEVYNVVEDLGEKHDIAGERPDLIDALGEDLAAWRRELASEPAFKGLMHRRREKGGGK